MTRLCLCFCRIGDGEAALSLADCQRCSRGARGGHDTGIALTRLAADHYQQNLPLRSRYDLRPHISNSTRL